MFFMVCVRGLNTDAPRKVAVSKPQSGLNPLTAAASSRDAPVPDRTQICINRLFLPLFGVVGLDGALGGDLGTATSLSGGSESKNGEDAEDVLHGMCTGIEHRCSP